MDELRKLSSPESPAKELEEENELLKKALANFSLPSNITYPSRVAANNVHRFILQLAKAYERALILLIATQRAYVAEHTAKEQPGEQKLGQGWIPVSEGEEVEGSNISPDSRTVFTMDGAGKAWRFDLPDLPPPPERP